MGGAPQRVRDAASTLRSRPEVAVCSATLPTVAAETTENFGGRWTPRPGAEVAILPPMRTVVGVLAIAAVGIHCSAPTEEGEREQTSAPELVAPAPTGDARSGASLPAPAAPVQEPIDSMGRVHSGSALQVTSSAYDDLGNRYATGTFVGVLSIGNTVIRSRGDKDVFLLKLDSAGAFQWVRAVGSASAESAPRVTLESTGRISVIGMTNGEMDCGSGPLPTWSSDTFFLCIFGRDGAALSSGVFPTGSP